VRLATRPVTDVPMYGHLPWPERKRAMRLPTPDPCPECGRGRVVAVSDDPRDVQWVCSARCGWDA
jgi:hypothetical protein